MLKKDEYTVQEKRIVWKIIFDLNACPNCLAINTMLEGPHGGSAVNIKCKECEQEFWVDPSGAFGAHPL